jgi:hypothetical protein
MPSGRNGRESCVCRVILVAVTALTPTWVLAGEINDTEKPAYLNVETTPDGVEIILNNETVGFAPISRLAFPPGEYRVSALFPGRERVEKDVVLETGTTTAVNFYSVGESEKGWFSERDALIGFGLVWCLMGFSILIGFSKADFG